MALDPGAISNMNQGDTLSITGTVPPGVDSSATVVTMTGGVDVENDDDLRARILHRIQNPPMGGAISQIMLAWALACPGVTRAWAASEMGIGTITVRFLMDELRAADDGWPNALGCRSMCRLMSIRKRARSPPRTASCSRRSRSFWTSPSRISCPATSGGEGREVEASIQDMLFQMAAPGQTIFSAWVSYAIMNAPSVVSFDLVTNDDYVMPSLGHMAVLETILYDVP